MIRIQCTDDFKSNPATIKVVGVGGAGGNAINRMREAGLRGVELIAANTDAQVLRKNLADIRIQMGEALTRGLGVGGDPARGKAAAEESRELIREVLTGSDMVFFTAGMGGGTGTGGAPVVAAIARELGILTVGVVSRPFDFEGRLKSGLAENGIKEMRQYVDTLLVIPNDRIFGVIEDSTPSLEAYRRADDVLRQAVQAVTDLITTSGDINLDLADVRSIMGGAGEALIGIGEASGPNRALEAAKKAVTSPLLESLSIDGAKGMIVNVCGTKSLPLHEVREAMDHIHRMASPEVKFKFGQAYDETMGDGIKITVIATGFPAARRGGRVLSREAAARANGAKPSRIALRSPVPFEPEHRPAEDAAENWLKPAFLRLKAKKLK